MGISCLLLRYTLLQQPLPLTPKVRSQYQHDGAAPGIFNDICWRRDLLAVNFPEHRFPFFTTHNFCP